MRQSHSSFLRLLCSFALIAFVLTSAGCSQLSALFGKKTADTIEEDPATDEDTGEFTDEDVEVDVEDVVDVPDVKKDVPDAKKTDVKDTKDSEPDLQDEPTDEDVQIDDVDDATDLTDVVEDIDVGIDVKDVDTGPDIAPDVDVQIDTGITIVGCKIDTDCGAVPASTCASKFLCLIDPINQTGTCVASLPATNGSACDDGNPCTVADVCNTGSCVGSLKDCEDGNVCTDDKCVATTGTCKHDIGKAGNPCSDGDECTVGDACAAGKCSPGNKNICDCKLDADCAVQDSPNLCDGKHICKGNICILDASTVTPPCPDLGLPCQENKCDPTTGQCAAVNRGNAAPCTDNNVCTFPDLCQDGACNSTPLICDDGNLCTDDTCVPGKLVANGAGCQYTPNFAPCDDGDLCTGNGKCSSGKCAKGALDPALCGCATDDDCVSYNSKCGGTFHCNTGNNKCELDPATVVSCTSAGNTTCQTMGCDEETGACAYKYTTAGVVCNDGNVCTVGDHCDGAGKCVKTSAFNCSDSDPCTNDFCLLAVGCIHPYNTLPCDDGNTCTGADKCALGKCIGNAYDAGGQLICQCLADKDCAYLDTNKCSAPHACSAAKACTLVGSSPPDPCASVNKSPCHTYACDPKTGACLSPNKVNGSVCTDDNWCTQNDGCKSGDCVGTLNPCSDGNDCTTDVTCDPMLGTAGCSQHPLVDDGTECVLSDMCQKSPVCTAGVCGGSPLPCDDGNPCTVDSCAPALGCQFTKATGTPCSDGNPCTGEDAKAADGSVDVGQDICVSGKCTAGKTKTCKVANAGPCYTSTCDPTKGTTVDPLTQKYACVQVTNTNPCQGGNMCITGQTCLSGVCQGGKDVDCNDANDCTNDYCWNIKDGLTPPGTCIHEGIGLLPCDDQNKCTTKDVCSNAGVCGGKAISSDDANPCTLDSCDPLTGPTHSNDPNGDCGPLAKCNNEAIPSCVFASKPILISELYIGAPNDPSDDWIEIYNPTANDVPIPGYKVEVAEAKPAVGIGWTTIAATDSNGAINAHGYLLFAHAAKVTGGHAADVIANTVNFHVAAQWDDKGVPLLDPNSVPLTMTVGQIRVRDGVTGLVQDQICFAPGGCTDGGKDIAPVTLGKSATSLERKASETSSATSMALHQTEWLAGNLYTDGATQNDNFVVRLSPDPQSQKSGVYEPACGGNCVPPPGNPLPTICNYNPAAEACVPDTACAVGCSDGETCNTDVQQCIINTPGLLVSEVLPGGQVTAGLQFIEIYNASATSMNISGFAIQTKTATQTPEDPQWTLLYQLPAGIILLPHHYYTVATDVYAATTGGVDAIVPTTLGLDPAGGALRLWDPRVDLVLDSVGWGTALAFTNGANVAYKAAPAPTPGNSLERLSADNDNVDLLKPGGLHCLAGNGWDTDHDDLDWVEQDVPSAQSLASGQFEPACGGMCSLGLVCPYTGIDGGKCADPQCGGICNVQSATSGGGYSCNTALATPACDLSGLVIAEVSPQGIDSTTTGGGTLKGIANEYIALYNRSNQDIVLDNLYISFRSQVGGSMPWATDADATKKPLTGVIHAHSYFLVVPSIYDSKLPAPDFVSTKTWGLDPATGAVRLNRYDQVGQSLVLDRLAWGVDQAMTVFGEPASTKVAAPVCPDLTQPCAIRRLPAAGVTADDVTSLFSPWYYAGAGWDTNSNKDNFVSTTTRTPHNVCLQPAGTCPAGSPGVPQKP